MEITFLGENEGNIFHQDNICTEALNLHSKDSSLTPPTSHGVVPVQSPVLTRRIGGDDFHARERRIVGLLALMAVSVSNVVAMLFVELVRIHDLDKLLSDVLNGLVHGHANSFDEVPILLAAMVLQMVMFPHRVVETLHARWEGFVETRNHGCREIVEGAGLLVIALA